MPQQKTWPHLQAYWPNKLVSRMSSDTQFLFISHNKITMEMAEQLIGVTMQEQGVSRVVAVDMEAAVHMAQT